MVDHAVLILADGQQSRWEAEGLKQLMMAGNETVIDRIVRQVTQRNLAPHISTHKKELMRPGAMPIQAAHNRWKVEGILYLEPFFGKRTTILLGDVIYTKNAISYKPFEDWRGSSATTG